jgi:Zn-dependent protease
MFQKNPGSPDDTVMPPSYPGAEFYRGLAQSPSTAQRAGAPPPSYGGAPILTPLGNPPAPPLPANPVMRFIVSWGGVNRLLLSIGSALLSVPVFYYLYFSGLHYYYQNARLPLATSDIWTLSIGFVVLLLVHELGHAFALRLHKLPATFPIFIPGLGAFVTLPNRPMTARTMAEIALAGPFLGGLGSLACLGIAALGFSDGSPSQAVFFILGFYGLFLNLLNLLPMLPLDGGIVSQAISPWLSLVGLGLLIYLYFLTHNLFFLIIGFLGFSSVSRLFTGQVRAPRMRAGDRVLITVLYIALAAMLYLGYQVIGVIMGMHGIQGFSTT